MIHVCYGLHDKDGHYSKLTGTSMLSMFENTKSEITVHILHDNTLTADNHEKFECLAERYGKQIKFYNVEKTFADKFAEFTEMMPSLNIITGPTVGTLFKFFIAKILPEDISKVIYLDSDIIVNLDINELWQIKINSEPLAAVPEAESYVDTNMHVLVKRNIVKSENYFNAGMFVMNLNRIRNEYSLIAEGIKFRMENTDCDCTDQDIWNYCFSKEYLKLPGKFNTLVWFARLNKDFDVENRICHLITSKLGLGFGLNTKDSYNKLWLKYFLETPWFNEEILGRMYETFDKIYTDERKAFRQVASVISSKDKNYMFYVTPKNIDRVKEIFGSQIEEKIIPVITKESLQDLAELMKKSVEKKVYILVVRSYDYCSDYLKREGFTEGKDFIDGRAFLSDEQSLPLNPYLIIKQM